MNLLSILQQNPQFYHVMFSFYKNLRLTLLTFGTELLWSLMTAVRIYPIQQNVSN